LRSYIQSALIMSAAATVIAAAGCSGGHSMLPSAGTSASSEARGQQPGSIVRATSNPPTQMQMLWLMTDGSVLGQSGSGSTWNQFYRYVPDSTGNYANGKWTQVGSLQAGYAPDASAADVMIDGRFALIGGEYNVGGGGSNYPLQLTNKAAVYDPVKMTWTPLGHPNRWKWIGDSPSTVLPNGLVAVGDKLHTWDATLDPKTLKWTNAGDKGKADFNAEEGWTLLPNGDILTADVKDAPNSELYNPTAGKWTSAGSTIVTLASKSPFHSCLQYGPKPQDCYMPPGEIGPSILRPDGTVFYAGSGQNGSGSGTGHTAIYNSNTGTWTAGPDFPNSDNAGDNFGVLEPSGNVIIFGNSGNAYEWNGSTFTELSGLQEDGSPILLPTGQIMMAGYNLVIYTPKGTPKASWAPTITNAPSNITAGQTYKITGTQFNGLSQAMAFGDEYQNATNYPLVRITNNGSGTVYYARTHDHSTMGVATGSQSVSTNFDVPSNAPAGASTLVVVANGIASKPVSVTVSGTRRRR